jgi:hypothetical protein
METARTYGRVIINEMHLPVEEKSIRPVSIGGVLGGAKYIVRGIMFKTHNTSLELFKNWGETSHRDELYIAHKVQGHELKGVSATCRAVLHPSSLTSVTSHHNKTRHTQKLKAYFGWFFQRGMLDEVSFPLMTLIDFKVALLLLLLLALSSSHLMDFEGLPHHRHDSAAAGQGHAGVRHCRRGRPVHCEERGPGLVAVDPQRVGRAGAEAALGAKWGRRDGAGVVHRSGGASRAGWPHVFAGLFTHVSARLQGCRYIGPLLPFRAVAVSVLPLTSQLRTCFPSCCAELMRVFF